MPLFKILRKIRLESSPAMPKRSQVRASRSFSAGVASLSQEEGWQQADMADSLAEREARGKDRQGLTSGPGIDDAHGL